MNENFVKVEILIDTTKPEQLESLNSLLSTIGGAENLAPAIAQVSTADPKPAQSKKRNSKQADPTSEPKPEKPSDPEPQKPADPEPQPEAKEYQIEEVREKLKEKVNDHREAIKAKLTELGAPNVSSLDPSKYGVFMNFLNDLQ